LAYKTVLYEQKPQESRQMKDTDCVQFGVIRISSWRSIQRGVYSCYIVWGSSAVVIAHEVDIVCIPETW